MCPLHLASEIDDSWRTQTQKQKKKEDTDERHGVLPERSAGVRIPRIITLGGRVALAPAQSHARRVRALLMHERILLRPRLCSVVAHLLLAAADARQSWLVAWISIHGSQGSKWSDDAAVRRAGRPQACCHRWLRRALLRGLISSSSNT